MVTPSAAPRFNEGEAGTRRAESVPLKLNARPTSPAVKVVPPIRMAQLVPAESLPFPSPRHQPTKPTGEGRQLPVDGGTTVSVASELSTTPSGLLTVTV